MINNTFQALVAALLFILSIALGSYSKQPQSIVNNAAEITNYALSEITYDTATPTVTQPISPPKNPSTRLPIPIVTKDNKPWGVSEKIGEHTYTIRLGNDERMGTANEIYEALNNYRKNHNVGYLAWDEKLAQYASTRAELFKNIQTTDAHAGLNDYLQNQDGFNKLGFNRVGENSYFGGPQLGVHVIEWVFSSSSEHNANQLDGAWSHVGIGATDQSVNIIFGGSKM